MDNILHKQKVEILSRLIKESSLTLEEALILLKENEQVIDIQPFKSQPLTNPYTQNPYTQPGTWSTVSGDSINCTNDDGSTWNSSISYAKLDVTPTL